MCSVKNNMSVSGFPRVPEDFARGKGDDVGLWNLNGGERRDFWLGRRLVVPFSPMLLETEFIARMSAHVRRYSRVLQSHANLRLEESAGIKSHAYAPRPRYGSAKATPSRCFLYRRTPGRV